MTKENALKYLPLINALAEGKTIQFKLPDGKWIDIHSSAFDTNPEEYRIKPEPREWWLVVTPAGAPVAVFDSESGAKDWNEKCAACEIRHLKEAV